MNNARAFPLAILNARNAAFDAGSAQARITKCSSGTPLPLAEAFWVDGNMVTMVRDEANEPFGWISNAVLARFRTLTGQPLPASIAFVRAAIFGCFATALIGEKTGYASGAPTPVLIAQDEPSRAFVRS